MKYVWQWIRNLFPLSLKIKPITGLHCYEDDLNNCRSAETTIFEGVKKIKMYVFIHIRDNNSCLLYGNDDSVTPKTSKLQLICHDPRHDLQNMSDPDICHLFNSGEG